jgi:hypothetical protein
MLMRVLAGRSNHTHRIAIAEWRIADPWLTPSD